ETLRKGYFRLMADDRIRSAYPKARLDRQSGWYDLDLNVKRTKDLVVDFGGNFASRPINTAFIGAQYNLLGATAVKVSANSYFGNFYGSVQAKARLDFPGRFPLFIEPQYTRNRWDYFESQSTFFEDDNPSYLIQTERFGSLKAGIPLNNKSRLSAGVTYARLIDEYYQTQNFTSSDTADRTTFEATASFLRFERGRLNHKLYPNSGSYLSVTARYIDGEEFNEPGSTSDLNRNFSEFRYWWQFNLRYQNYYKPKGTIRLGLLVEAAYSTQDPFNNYTASILRAPAFTPNVESRTLFLESFRAFQFVGVGHQFIINLFKQVDLRLAGYIFQPYKYIEQNAELGSDIREDFDTRFSIATAAAVYKSPLGPLSVGVNYYPESTEIVLGDRTPLTFLFHFGYVIFNNRAIQ
ncbi:MAG: hypothetical protein AAGB22_07735, partial [Bacteroidota bacterium]